MKMPTAELYLEEATVIYGFYLLTARLPELTWKLCERLDCLHLFNSRNTAASFQLSDEYGIVEVQVVEMTEAAATEQASVTTLHVSLSVVWAFLQK